MRLPTKLPLGVFITLLGAFGSQLLLAEEHAPLFVTADLSLNEPQKIALPNGESAAIRLLSVSELKGEVWGEIAYPEIEIEVNGERTTLVAGMYRLPRLVGGVQIDCPITGKLKENSHIDHWGLDADARVRLWPANSKWIRPNTFSYPVRQEWFATQTSFSNEPVAPRPNGQLYYHAGLDIGGAEGMVDVIAATDALVVSRGLKVMKGHEKDTPLSHVTM